MTVSDGIAPDVTDTFAWTITDTNRAPSFDQDLRDRTSAEGAIISLDAGATDPDRDTLTYSATGLPAGLAIDASTGLISGTVGYAAASTTAYAVEVTVSDGIAPDVTDTFTWTITDTNRAPSFDQDLLDRTSAEGAVISLDAGATDPDLDTLTYSATGLPAGLAIDASTGLISGTVGYAAASTTAYAVEVTVSDGIAPDVPTPSPGRSRTRTGPRASIRTCSTGRAPRAPSSASTPGRATSTATP